MPNGNGSIPPPPSGFTLDPTTPAGPAPPPGFALDPVASPQNAVVSAQPSTFTNWLQNAEADVRYGGARTAIGRVLSALGAQGTDVGSQAGAGGMLASPVLGPIHYLQGMAQMPSHPISGAIKGMSGALETATIPLMFAGGPETATPGSTEGAINNLIAAVKPSPLQAAPFQEAAQTAAPEIKQIAATINPQTRAQALSAITARSISLQPTYDAALSQAQDEVVPQDVLNSIADRIEGHITPGLNRRFPDLAGRIQQTADLYRTGQNAQTVLSGTPPTPITYGELENMRYDLGSDLRTQLEANGLNESLVRRDPNYAYRLTERDAVKNALYDRLGPEAARVKEMQSALQTIQRVMTAAAGRDLVNEATSSVATPQQRAWAIAKNLADLHAGSAAQAVGDALINPGATPNAQIQRSMQLFGARQPTPIAPIVGNLAGMISGARPWRTPPPQPTLVPPQQP